MDLFEELLRAEIYKIRDAFQPVETISSFEFIIKASGRIHGGEIKLEFKLVPDQYSVDYVKGNNIEALVTEVLRRKGWNDRNAPLSISYSPEP